ncbi:hypothetical protein GGQ68_001780 [Sagittula marina]|uniref:Uncharacterized protein n=1 Tax=Sagittula marina TaxID=943940 RepID=A0A7W6DMC2_9RHOB|nr:hypothetical protein [Sagittula marina]MBB3985447.1 hypothetical protein [Sagittula marina]
MTIEYTFHPDQKLAFFRFFNQITVQDCVETFRAYVAHPDFRPDDLMLSDTRQLEGIDATCLGIIVAVERLLPCFRAFPDTARSIIYAKNDLIFGMARMMQQVIEPVSTFEFQIHRTEADALAAANMPQTSLDDLARELGVLAPLA